MKPLDDPIRTVVAVEHPATRDQLTGWLEREPDLRIVGSAGTGRAAVNLVRETRPDLLLIKVELPELDAFAVLDALAGRVPPAIVLVAARPEYAVRAFGRKALDYLLQPIDPNRLQVTLERVRDHVARLHLHTLPENGAAAPPRLLAIPAGGRLRLLSPEQIKWIQARGRHCHVHLEDAVVKATLPIRALEQRLPTDEFMRVSRSVMVRIARVREARPKSHGDHWLVLDTGEQLVLSRNRRGRAFQRLGGAA